MDGDPAGIYLNEHRNYGGSRKIVVTLQGKLQPFESCETFALSQHLYKLVRQRIEAGFMRVVDCTS